MLTNFYICFNFAQKQLQISRMNIQTLMRYFYKTLSHSTLQEDDRIQSDFAQVNTVLKT